MDPPNDDYRCPICGKEVILTDKHKIFECGHIFHRRCINAWETFIRGRLVSPLSGKCPECISLSATDAGGPVIKDVEIQSSGSINDKQCAICMYDLGNSNLIETLECSVEHKFHKYCIFKNALRGETRCPLCMKHSAKLKKQVPKLVTSEPDIALTEDAISSTLHMEDPYGFFNTKLGLSLYRWMYQTFGWNSFVYAIYRYIGFMRAFFIAPFQNFKRVIKFIKSIFKRNRHHEPLKPGESSTGLINIVITYSLNVLMLITLVLALITRLKTVMDVIIMAYFIFSTLFGDSRFGIIRSSDYPDWNREDPDDNIRGIHRISKHFNIYLYMIMFSEFYWVIPRYKWLIPKGLTESLLTKTVIKTIVLFILHDLTPPEKYVPTVSYILGLYVIGIPWSAMYLSEKLRRPLVTLIFSFIFAQEIWAHDSRLIPFVFIKITSITGSLLSPSDAYEAFTSGTYMLAQSIFNFRDYKGSESTLSLYLPVLFSLYQSLLYLDYNTFVYQISSVHQR